MDLVTGDFYAGRSLDFTLVRQIKSNLRLEVVLGAESMQEKNKSAVVDESSTLLWKRSEDLHLLDSRLGKHLMVLQYVIGLRWEWTTSKPVSLPNRDFLQIVSDKASLDLVENNVLPGKKSGGLFWLWMKQNSYGVLRSRIHRPLIKWISLPEVVESFSTISLRHSDLTDSLKVYQHWALSFVRISLLKNHPGSHGWRPPCQYTTDSAAI